MVTNFATVNQTKFAGYNSFKKITGWLFSTSRRMIFLVPHLFDFMQCSLTKNPAFSFSAPRLQEISCKVMADVLLISPYAHFVGMSLLAVK